MTLTSEVEIIGKQTIKPSSPTPVDLKSFRLSLLDQIAPVAYIPLLMFYPGVDIDIDIAERSDRLKKSLAETLNRYYVLAGKVDGYASIDCNDDGAEFIEARIDCVLSDVLNPPNADVLKIFLPAQIESVEAATGCLLLVQSTYFKCGGMAVGLCISHKVADASSLSAFIKTWSAVALGADDVAAPLYVGASLMPPLDFSIPMPAVELPKRKCMTTRLVFDGTKIAELKRKVVSENVTQPTRVEAVTALIWKCAMSSSRSNSGFQKPSFLCHTVNLRKRIEPPLPGNSIGNLLAYFTAQTNGQDVDLHVLVEQLRSGIKEFKENGAKKVQESGFAAICEGAKELASMWSRDDLDFYTYSSWCRFELYGADFGWGKPSWVSITSSTFSNTVILMDTKDGEGIEAWLTLSEEEMVEFERNEKLLAFASLNPSILI